jgi:sorting nexin-13
VKLLRDEKKLRIYLTSTRNIQKKIVSFVILIKYAIILSICPGGSCRRQVLWISKQILQLVMEDAIDDWILRQINSLRRDDVVSRGILWVQDVWIFVHDLFSFPNVMGARLLSTYFKNDQLLWPNGTFFTRVEGYQPKMQQNQNQGRFSMTQSAEIASQFFEEQLEASRRANDVKKLLLGELSFFVLFFPFSSLCYLISDS